MLGHYQILTGSGHGCKAWIGRSHNNYGLQIRVTGFCDKVLEFIKVFIYGATLLEISCGFQSVDGRWVCIDWTKLPLELVSEVFPINEFMVANVFRLFLPTDPCQRLQFRVELRRDQGQRSTQSRRSPNRNCERRLWWTSYLLGSVLWEILFWC